jgi:class 3 adenylate cyclase
MFCDVVNSTGLSEKLDPEELRDIMRLYNETCAKVIRRFDGFVAKYLGDGMLVHFGYPVAHEDDAQRAVRAGLGMLEAIKFTDFHRSNGTNVPFEIRIGVHTGLVVIDEIGAEAERKMDIIGETPNIAARLMSLAQPNALVVSASTYRLISGFFEEEDLGSQMVRGISQPIGVYRILHESTARTRLEAKGLDGLTPLIGRDSEMARLQALWANVVEGEGQCVLVSGEAGIGKSRITGALKLHITKEHDAWLTETECSPYHQNTAFYPVSQFLQRTALGFLPDDSAEERYAKTEGFLAQSGFDLLENIPLLAPILSLPVNPNYPPLDPLALGTRQKTLALLLNLLMRRAAVQPTLFILEDLHWADPSTLELAGMIIQQAPTSRLLAFFSFRPEFKPTWVGMQNVQLMNLNRLGQNQTRELIDYLVDHKKLPESIAEQILKKTDGVPLFIEELTKTVLEGGNFVLVGGDRYELEGKQEFEIPATLKDSLMARLDRLSTSKLVAQTAATIGREFSHKLLGAVVRLDDAILNYELKQLTDAGLIFQRGFAPNATYIFKHALVQDAAYESQLRTHRQEMHRKINEAILQQFPEIVESQPETLAIHYTEAGMIPEAIGEWLRAGQQADKRYAAQEAIGDYQRGLDLLATLASDHPAQAYELPVQLFLGIALLMSCGYSAPEVGIPLSRARELCAAVPNAPQLPIILWSLWAYYVVMANHRESYPLAEELWKVAKERNKDGLIIEASFPLGFEYFLRFGEFARSANEMKRIREMYVVEKHSAPVTGYVQDVLACALSWEGWAEFILGHPENARAIMRQNMAHHKLLNHPYSSAYAGVCLGALAVLMEDVALAETFGMEAMKVSVDSGYPFFLGIASYVLGWVRGKQGDFAASMQMFEQGITVWNAMGSKVWRSLPYTWKIETHLSFSDYEGAAKALEAAYDEAEKTEEHFMQQAFKRLEGLVVLGIARSKGTANGLQAGVLPEARAEELFRESISISRQRGAKSYELLALLSLHDLLRGTSRAKAVLDDIRAVYETYTDGHDLPLLQRVQQALAETNVVREHQIA